MIEMRGVSKTYRVRRRDAGLGSAARSLFSRRYEEIPALLEMSFTIPDGQIVGYIGPNWCPGRTGSATWPGWGWSSDSAASCGGTCR